MQIAIHTGAHFTDEERLIKCLVRNKDSLARQGVAVPGPSRYRSLLKKTFDALKDAQPSPDAREVLLDAILDEADCDRMVLSNPNFFGAPRAALRRGMLYPNAGPRMATLAGLFPGDQLEMFIGLRNPASFLPEVFKKSPKDDFLELTGGVDPRLITWSDMIRRVRAEAPDVPITVWCNEDTPLIWSQIVREIAGLDHGATIEGEFDLLQEIMSKEGMRRFLAYLDTHNLVTEMQVRRVISAFLDKFALEDKVEEELDLRGWDDAMVEELTEIYDEDVFDIERLPGVTLIEP